MPLVASQTHPFGNPGLTNSTLIDPVATLISSTGPVDSLSLAPQHSSLSTHHSALRTQHSSLSTQNSSLSTQNSELSTQNFLAPVAWIFAAQITLSAIRYRTLFSAPPNVKLATPGARISPIKSPLVLNTWSPLADEL